MPASIKNIIGKMNLDYHPAMLPPNDYGEAYDIVRDAQGKGQDMVVSNMVGNTQVPYTFHSGINKRIGSFPDNVRNRIYRFVWNSLGFHTIMYWDKATNTNVKLIVSKTDSKNIDVLGFNPSYRINHIDIIYRDEEGDLLFWTDGLNQPSKLNVLTASLGLYNPYVRTYLNVAKEPPQFPPYCVYEDDVTVKVNTMRKKLFRLKARFVYDDGEKSSCSSISEVPLPLYYSYQTIDSDPTKNANILAVLQTGEKNVVKIEVLVQQSLGNVWGDFFLVEVLDKASLTIPDNDIWLYRFYNDKAYNYIDINESIQLFDWVPQKAVGQGLLNGNVMAYGGITESFNLKKVALSIDDTLVKNALELYETELLYATDVDISGTNFIRIVVGGTPSVGDTFLVTAYNGTTTLNITYTVVVGDTIADILTGLLASAVTNGFTGSITPNVLTIHRAGYNFATYLLTIAQKFTNLVAPASVFYNTVPNTLTIGNFTDLSYFPPGQQFIVTNSVVNPGIFTVVNAVLTYSGATPTVVITLVESPLFDIVTDFTLFQFINNINFPAISIPAYDFKSKGQFAVVYFDIEERTCGVVFVWLSFSLS